MATKILSGATALRIAILRLGLCHNFVGCRRDGDIGQLRQSSPLAWNPSFSKDSVIRGGYGRIYGRLNGVDLVLVPLLGTGLIQPVQCFGPRNDHTCPGSTTASNAFRVGTDGLVAPIPAATPTLPQPLFPGINGIAAGAGEALDPHFRPNVVDSFNLTVQRQLHKGMTFELGYIGRRIQHEYQPININANSSANLSAPINMANGAEPGMLFFADRNAPSGNSCGNSGNGSCADNYGGGATATYSGIIYNRNNCITMDGNSSQSQYSILVADCISLQGTSSINNNYSSLPNGQSPLQKVAVVE